MKISAEEQQAIREVVALGATWGYGNLITHLHTAWARSLQASGLSEKAALAHAGGRTMPFAMQDDLLERGEWDETGERYRPTGSSRRSSARW